MKRLNLFIVGLLCASAHARAEIPAPKGALRCVFGLHQHDEYGTMGSDAVVTLPPRKDEVTVVKGLVRAIPSDEGRDRGFTENQILLSPSPATSKLESYFERFEPIPNGEITFSITRQAQDFSREGFDGKPGFVVRISFPEVSHAGYFHLFQSYHGEPVMVNHIEKVKFSVGRRNTEVELLFSCISINAIN